MITIFLFPGVCNSVGEDEGRLSSPPPTNDTTARKIAAATVAGLGGGGFCAARFHFCGKNKRTVPGCFPHFSDKSKSHDQITSYLGLILKPRTFQTQKLDLGARFQQDC